MKIEFSRIPLEVRTQEFKIADIVELSAEEFEKFSKRLNEDYDFIAKNANKYRVDEEGVAQCLLVLGKGQDDGILVLSEGYSYAPYGVFAICENNRTNGKISVVKKSCGGNGDLCRRLCRKSVAKPREWKLYDNGERSARRI